MIKGKEVLHAYLMKIFNGSNMKVKITACRLISGMILAKPAQKEIFLKPFYDSMLDVTFQLFNNKQEDDLKKMMQIIIKLYTNEPEEGPDQRPTLLLLSKTVFEYKGFAEERLRELSFELVLSLVDHDQYVLGHDHLKALLEAFFDYGHESEGDDQKWETPSISYIKDVKEIEEEKIYTMQLQVERLIQSTDIDPVLPVLESLIENGSSHSDWLYKYSALALRL